MTITAGVAMLLLGFAVGLIVGVEVTITVVKAEIRKGRKHETGHS